MLCKYYITIFVALKAMIMTALKNKNITLRVSEEFAKLLKDFAKKKFMSQANLIEYLVRREIEETEKAEGKK